MSSTDLLDSLREEYSSKNTIPFTSLSRGSGKKVWWECALGHEWEATPLNRTAKNSGCPVCAGRKVLAGFNDLASAYPELAQQWSAKNPKKAHEVVKGSHKEVWWQCEKGHEWTAKISNRIYGGTGCPVCAGKKILPGVNDLATVQPILMKEWSVNNTIDPTTIGSASEFYALWLCIRGHEWKAKISRRVYNKTGCPECARLRPAQPGNSLLDIYPHLAAEWSSKNQQSAEEVSYGSKQKHWWECKEGHEWKSTISNRVTRPGQCPYCSGRKAIPGRTDLATIRPDLALQWSKKNRKTAEETVVTSPDYAWWTCSLGHEWQAGVKDRARRPSSSCPVCLNRVLLPSFNDLETLFPKIAQEWSPRNDLKPWEVGGKVHTKVWWLCNKGHEWKATIASRTSGGTGCPHCSRRISKMETEVADFLKSLLPDVEVRTSVRDVIAPKELDIYIPSKNLAVEFNGLYWHTEAQGKDKDYHRAKWQACRDQGIQLIQIWEDQWRDNPDVVKRMLAHKVGASQEKRVAARKTEVVLLDKVEAAEFLNSYHIQGFASGSYYLGLRIKGSEQVVALMVLKRQGGDMILSRYATSAHVVGGQSKLVKYAERNFEYGKLITFADLEVSDGSLYERTGFVKDKELKPDYRYLFDGERRHKFGFRLKRFREDPDLLFEEGLSERELALLNGIERLWDTGKIRYVKPHPDSLPAS